MVQDNWERDLALSGSPPVAPESVLLNGYRAHFFILEKDVNRKIAFRTPDDKSVVIEPRASRFELVGNHLNDASENMGPLFGERPPSICSIGDWAWKDIHTIVVGEEGRLRGRWRMAFSPVQSSIEQDLPREVSARKCGWYFIRFYNTDGDLIESLDFRFICGLRRISIHQLTPAPPEGGHDAVYVEFLYESGYVIKPSDDVPCNILINHEDKRTILSIPPGSSYDETCWLVGPKGGPQLIVTILAERLWWNVAEEGNTPSEWVDRLLTLERNDFASTSKKVLWLRLPKRRWADEVFVGFREKSMRGYSVKVAENTVVIPLRDFGDAQELQDISKTPFYLQISHEGTTYMITPVELIVKVTCRLCEFAASSKEDILCHVVSFHMDQFFRLLSYEEMRDRIPSLPYSIYKCHYCTEFVKSSDPTNPTSAICNHFKERHDDKRIDFMAIFDIEEIRKNVIRDLPSIYECTLCGSHLDEPTESKKKEHLVESHRNRLYSF
jgi:hypothetical protein